MEFYNDIEISFTRDSFDFSFVDIGDIHLIDEKFETIINSDPNDFTNLQIEELDPDATWDASEGESAAIGLEIKEILSSQEEKIFSDLNFFEETILKENDETCERIEENLSEFLDFNKGLKKGFKLKPYSCGVCNWETSNRYYFQQHFRTAKHTKNASKMDKIKNEEILYEILDDHDILHTFRCDDCGSSFPRRKNLSDHIRDIHLIFKCSMCNRRFKSEKEFNLHATRHSKSNNFECLVCHKKFTNNQNLKRHERSHKEAKKYECSICGKNFGQKTNLLRHFKVH